MTEQAALVEELTTVPDAFETCVRFADLPYLLWLDSAANPERLGRYSFLMADPAVLVRSKNGRTERADRHSGAVVAVTAADPLDTVRELLAPNAVAPIPGLPPFQGGVAGYIGYDWGAGLERIPRARSDDLAVPDVVLGLYDWVIAWDHQLRRAWIISTGIPDRDPARRASERIAWVKQRLGGKPAATSPARAITVSHREVRQRPPLYPVTDTPAAAAIGLRSNFSRDGYIRAVARVVEYIRAGDLFQANLSQRLEVQLAEPPLGLYRRLRAVNPAPFAAYFDCGDLIVASSSPERFVHVRDGWVETRPIKGTRPRGVGPEHDAALGLALTESEKDRAENAMIVDLLRNDLSRVCVPGTVRAPELFTLEHYATVHHLVSTVVGKLAPGHDIVDLLRATFPGGSITGAPKIRAMQIIAELEPSQRGVYCGSIGYMSRTGVSDTNIAIRTYTILGSDVYFQVGGGIVADSDPEQEYWETLYKGEGLVAALAGAPHPDAITL